MKHYGIGLDQVLLVCRQMNQNANGGVLYEFDNEYIIRGVVSTDHVDEIAKGVVTVTPDNVPVLLQDIATVKVGGKKLKGFTLSHQDLVKAGTLEFVLSEEHP